MCPICRHPSLREHPFFNQHNVRQGTLGSCDRCGFHFARDLNQEVRPYRVQCPHCHNGQEIRGEVHDPGGAIEYRCSVHGTLARSRQTPNDGLRLV